MNEKHRLFKKPPYIIKNPRHFGVTIVPCSLPCSGWAHLAHQAHPTHKAMSAMSTPNRPDNFYEENRPSPALGKKWVTDQQTDDRPTETTSYTTMYDNQSSIGDTQTTKLTNIYYKPLA